MDKNGFTPAAIAARVKNGWWDPTIMDKCGFTPLAIAARSGDVKEVHRLLTAGAAVEVKPAPMCRCNCEWEYRVETPLHLAAMYGHLDVVNLLISDDAPKPSPKTFKAALFSSVSCWHSKCVEALLSSSHLSSSDPLRFTSHDNEDVDIKYLLNEQVGFRFFNGGDRSTMSGVGYKQEELNAKLHAMNPRSEEDALAMLKSLVSHGFDPNGSGIDPGHPLMKGILKGHVYVVRGLIENGANVSIEILDMAKDEVQKAKERERKKTFEDLPAFGGREDCDGKRLQRSERKSVLEEDVKRAEEILTLVEDASSRSSSSSWLVDISLSSVVGIVAVVGIVGLSSWYLFGQNGNKGWGDNSKKTRQ